MKVVVALDHVFDVSIEQSAVLRNVAFSSLFEPMNRKVLLSAQRTKVLDFGDLVKCLEVIFHEVDVQNGFEEGDFRVLAELWVDLFCEVEYHPVQIVDGIFLPLWHQSGEVVHPVRLVPGLAFFI